MIRRREFIAGLGGAVAWPVVARGQQADGVQRVGVLVGYDENDPWRRLLFLRSFKRECRSQRLTRTGVGPVGSFTTVSSDVFCASVNDFSKVVITG